jgi:hypothetical protein
MDNQGEVAVVIERNEETGECYIVGHAAPKDKVKFEQKELRDVYLAQAIHESKLEDDEREKVQKYLYQTAFPRTDTKAQPRGVFGQEIVEEYDPEEHQGTQTSVFAGKKYKKVADKVRPVYQDLPEKYRIIRDIKGDPLEGMLPLSTNPPDFVPTGRYTQERKEKMDEYHDGDFLWPEERKLVHQLIMQQNEGFAWDDTEKGRFRTDFFPPVEIPTVEHEPWVLRNIPIPPGMHKEVCDFIKTKIDAGTYEPSSSSYRSRWFTVMKKDGKSFRIVHSLEPLNAVTIAHSGLPPAMESLAEHFAGRACGGILDLYVGYDERLLAESSRDLTTFQTPYGALRLVSLPMGWTNSVPIFHEDVTHILREEIPEVTEPYIDDVPIRGPATRYELEGGGYEVIKENPGIRRFVWEHMNNVNRVVQRMKYCGGTFSGYKSKLCASEIVVVGHLCTYEGRKPMPDKVHTILNWGPCKNISDVRAFMGTVGLLRIYITDYSSRAQGIQKLMRNNAIFEWGPEQEESMRMLKEGVSDAKCVLPLDHTAPGAIVLAVDTSWRAVGFYIYQEDPSDKKKKRYARFGSILLTEREQRFSQPKRELFGLLRALLACHYWIIGVRKLIVETDAKYLKGMLENPGIGPNATINRWIDNILMFHFELRHVAGKTFGPDGLSRREGQPGDEQYENPEEGADEVQHPLEFVKKFDGDSDPLEISEFKNDIDTRGGYILSVDNQPQWEEITPVALSASCFSKELSEARYQLELEKDMARKCLKEKDVPESQKRFIQQFVLRDAEPEIDSLEYDESNRTEQGIEMDAKIPLFKAWVQDPKKRPKGMSDKQYFNFVRSAKHFFVDKQGRLYRRSVDDEHKLFVEKRDRTRMMHSAHDSLGHRGSYATRQLLMARFWWPELERDVHQYVKTCHLCQERQKTMIKIPRTETHTPSIFQQLHVDTMHMTPPSDGCAYIVHGRCALTSWVEGRPLKKENAKSIADWLFEDILCRWGCLREIITDNGGPFVKAIKMLGEKWGIHGITISAYNSKANGKIERPHWDIRQMLFKACGGEDQASKWHKYFHYVLWADRVTIRKGFGCSPFFMVTGAQPVLPMDIVEATWLVKLPDRILTEEELIGYRARALAKHKEHIDEMRARVSKTKRDMLRKFEERNVKTIKEYDFKPGELVLLRNSPVEMSLNRKMRRRWEGPYLVVFRKKGGAYILADMSGHVLKDKVAAFRVIPYFARRNLKIPENITEILDQSEESLKAIISKPDDENEDRLERLIYNEEDREEEQVEDVDSGEEENWWND